MPKNSILINTARKEIVHESEMLEFMKERSDFKYITDVLPDNHEEMQKNFGKDIFQLPKNGCSNTEANINAGIAAAQQIVDFLKNGNRKYQVN